jgi:hypothetical protein
MGLHNPFGHLKHKLWPKEGRKVKLAIWLPTIKSWKSPWFPYVQVVCHIPLEIYWQRIQFCFKPHLNWRFAHKVMGPRSHRSPNSENFGIPIWESQDKMTFGCWSRWLGTKYTIMKKVVASPKSWPWWVLWICVCSWLIRALKCSNYARTNLLLSWCRSIWIIELLFNLPSLIPKLQDALLPSKCCELRSAPQLFLLPLSSPLDSQLLPSRSLGVCH